MFGKKFLLLTQKLLVGWILCLLFTTLLTVNNVYAQQEIDKNAMDSDEIRKFLTGRMVQGSQNGIQWRQAFNDQGETILFQDGFSSPAQGSWKPISDLYCSMWPPSAHWECYVVYSEGEKVIFIPEGGGVPWPAIRVKK